MQKFGTGATITKNSNIYNVEYKGKVVGEFHIKDLAVMLALDRVRLEHCLESSNVFLIKAG